MKKYLFTLIFFCSSLNADELQFNCFSETSTFENLVIDIEKKLIFFEGLRFDINILNNRFIEGVAKVDNKEKILIDRYSLEMKWIRGKRWDAFKCKLLSKKF